MLPCCVCGDNIQTEAAHIRQGDYKLAKPKVGVAEKPDDMWTVPLCGKCHRHQHEGNEGRFWEIAEIKPLIIALRLYSVTGDYEQGCRVIAANCEHVSA
jgi:hypothetical protein